MSNSDTNIWSVVLKLKSPLQVGAGDIGMIEQTELYVPNRTIWGAFVATLTDTHWSKLPKSKRPYLEIGKKINTDSFSSFFLSEDKGEKVWLPKFQNNERIWIKSDYDFHKSLNGNCRDYKSESYLRSRFVYGITGNAIAPDNMTSEDGMLFSTDTVMPQVLSDDGCVLQVYLKGFYRLPQKLSIESDVGITLAEIELSEVNVKNIFNNMRIGGSRKRGRGIVNVVEIKEETSKNNNEIKFSQIQYDDKKTILLEPKKVDENDNVEGRAILSVYRQHSKDSGSGRDFKGSEICWSVGSVNKSFKQKVCF